MLSQQTPLQGEAPALQPNPAQTGVRMKGIAMVQLAMKMLESALPAVGSESEEGKALLKSLNQLSTHFGQSAQLANDTLAKMLMQQQALNVVRQQIALKQQAQQQMAQQQMAQQQGGIV